MAFDRYRGTLPYRIVALQICATVACAGLWSLAGLDRAVASALGGCAVFVPNGFMAWRVAAQSPENGAIDEARRLLAGTVAKLVLAVAFMVGAFVWYGPEPVAFFVTLMAVQAVHWIAPWLDVPRRRRI